MALSFIVKKPLPLEAEDSLMKLLHKEIPSYESDRPKSNVHASSAVEPDFCPREYALHFLHSTIKQKATFVPTALQLTYDFGNETQQRLNEVYLPQRVYGEWKCRVCNKARSLGKKPLGKTCSVGNIEINCNWGYQEVRVKSAFSGITGGLDMLVDLEGSTKKLKVVEVKTLAKDQFNDLQAAIPEHRLRTNLYLRLIAESTYEYKDRIDTDSGIILYVSKGYGQKSSRVASWKLHDSSISPFKEFVVKRNDDHTNVLSDKAREVQLFKQGKASIPVVQCATMYCEKAANCAVAKICFSDQYPVGYRG